MVSRRKPEPAQLAQPGLFDEPEPEPVEAPQGAKPARAPVKYESYTGVTGKCADCELLVYEQIRETGGSGHLIRRARVKRIHGAEQLLLCQEHSQLRQVAEATKPKPKRKRR